MKGLMFNNKHSLEDEVLDATKTMTRRHISNKLINQYEEWIENARCISVPEGTSYETLEEFLSKLTPYEIGEVVAIKQAYNIAIHELDWCNRLIYKDEVGWNNKMFVCNDLMPHQVKIAKVFPQRLQDISNEDCLKEGVIKNQIGYYVKGIRPNSIHGSYTIVDDVAYKLFPTPKEAYAALINKLNGKGTWDKNDWVWAIEFELIK